MVWVGNKSVKAFFHCEMLSFFGQTMTETWPRHKQGSLSEKFKVLDVVAA
jgi:hypothetical protein